MMSPTAQIEPPEINGRISLLLEPLTEIPDSSVVPVAPTGALGIYRITFALVTPGREIYRRNQDLGRLLQTGESLLLARPGMSTLKIEVFREKQGELLAEVHFHKNGRGELATALTRIHAQDFRSAELQGLHVVLPILSWWSFCFDVALDIGPYEILEETSGITSWNLPSLGRHKQLDIRFPAASQPKHRFLLAAYREALNATNPFYRFLSFYRVAEGIRRLRASGEQVNAVERVPETAQGADEDEAMKPDYGKKCTAVLEELRPTMRNAIAHMNPLEEDTLMADNPEDVVRCGRATPVMHLIARQMLLNQLRLDPAYAAVGAVDDSGR